MPRNTIQALEQLPVWQRLQAQGSAEQIDRVTKLVAIATDKLAEIRDTFPTYTLHDREHADNVVWLMGELLGDQVSRLSALEAAMLVLSAYFHDAGMAFSEEERQRLHTAERFDTFLAKHSEALVSLEKAPDSEVPADVAEWFCRWDHAERVFAVLNEVARTSPELLKWSVLDLREPLGYVCRSHHLDAANLNDDNLFPVAFLDCDTRFVAILLRLADILDFDRTRSPHQLYLDLGLSPHLDKREKTSDLEWRKHLAADGFRFPAARPPSYAIDFVAGPDEPAVEHDIRQFLDLIEGELVRCNSAIRSCSDRWRDHALPGRVDRRLLRGNGYTYGDYRFTLDQHQVLNLLMGERLYANPYTFVRELLQNALDASRHREFHERTAGNTDFVCEPIRVSSWFDGDGYQWIEVDDRGMGMTEEIIREFLLKVGCSYYASSQFEADVIRYSKRTHEHFRPVSRFGIGLLSCFIVGDRVEIATRHAAGGGAIRLSLPGLQHFFVLQKPPNTLRDMPGNKAPKSPDRPAGTTVAVRLDARKEQGNLHLKKELEDCLLCPTVLVLHYDEPIGLSGEGLLSRPWCAAGTITLDHESMARLGSVLEHRFLEPLQIRLIPVDLTACSPIAEVRGQLIVATLDKSTELATVLASRPLRGQLRRIMDSESRSIDLRFSEAGDSLEIAASFTPALAKATSRDERDRQTRRGFAATDIQSSWILSPELRSKVAARRHRGPTGLSNMEVGLVSHNGIALPGPKYTSLLSNIRSGFRTASWGLLMLSDRLRPDLSVARDHVVALGWNIRSAGLLAFRRALSAHLPAEEILRVDDIFNLGSSSPELSELLEDELISDPLMWPQEKVFLLDNGAAVSINDFLNDSELAMGWRPVLDQSSLNDVRAALVRIWLSFTVEVKTGRSARLVVRRGARTTICEGEKLFEPLRFAPYSGDHGGILRAPGMPLRSDHPFSVWVLTHGAMLSRDFGALFRRLRSLARETPDRINQVLRRIGELRPEIAPPPSAFLKAGDL